MTDKTTNLAFNTNFKYGENNGSWFLGEPRGLIDSVHRTDTRIFDKYKLLKVQDWDENDFPMADARSDFTRFPKEGEMMLNNIGWQWSGDSTAANCIVPMVAPFRPASDLWLWYGRQGENENLHALSYSESVKISVPDGMREIQRIHDSNDTMRRVSYVSETMDHLLKVGSKINLGMIKHDSNEASDALMLMLGAIFILERGQFMPSFLNTAILYFQNKFKPIGDTIRKVAIDEWGTHIPVARMIIQHELQFKERRESLERIRPQLTKLLEEVIHNEVTWNARQFSIGGEQLGMTEQMGADYAYFAGTDIANELYLTPNFKKVYDNPAPIMDNFLNLNREKTASMEQKGGNYQVVHIAKASADDEDLDLDGL